MNFFRPPGLNKREQELVILGAKIQKEAMSTPTNTPTSKLEAVRAKVIEAVPEINQRQFVLVRSDADQFDAASYEPPITLADVLRAIFASGNESYFAVGENGYFVQEVDGDWKPRREHWNLALPLDEQEPEVIDFLAKILCL